MAVAALLACCAGAVAAAPFRPADDRQVLVRLPAAERPRLTEDRATAVGRARLQIERARRTGDPRFLGYAQGLLLPWWNAPQPPADVLLLRATLLQSRHDFAGALRDLDHLLEREPDHPEALLTRATVLRVQGRLPEAAADCARLRRPADAFVATLCRNAIRGLGGERDPAAQALERLVPDSRTQPAPVRAWLAAERADLAERAGDAGRALAIHVSALGHGLDDPHLLASMIDLLLQTGRVEEAARFAENGATSDALRLRGAIAARRLHRPQPELEAALAESFAAANRRGTGAHLREEARFALEVEGDAARALDLAIRNWQTQREPADARLLAAAARAAREPARAAPVRAHVAATGLQDAALERLLAP